MVALQHVAPHLLEPALDQAERRRFNEDEVATMLRAGVLDEDEPIELLEGQLVLMSPQNPAHVNATQRIARLLDRVYGELHGERVHTRSHSPLRVDAQTVPEPDVALVRGPLDDFAARHAGAADTILVVEVAETSRSRDRAKAALYGAGGAPVYWIVDLPGRRLEVRSELRDGDYTVVRILGEEAEVELPETGQRVAVSRLLPPPEGDAEGPSSEADASG